MNTNVIDIKNLTKYYDTFLAVDNISLSVTSGELFGFLGPNGAGKTTCLTMLAGLLQPSSGDISIFDYNMQKDPLPAKQKIAFIPDRPFLYDKLTGLEMLKLVDQLYQGDPKTFETRANDALERFGLANFSQELIEGYSHGMKQRLVFAGATIHDPELLIVDEPMVGLDPHGAKLVKTVFKETCQKGGSVLLSTHTLQVAQEICDRIAIINHGKIIALGTMEELREQAQAQDSNLEELFLILTSPHHQETDLP